MQLREFGFPVALLGLLLVACGVGTGDSSPVNVRATSVLGTRIVNGTPSTAAQDSVVLLLMSGGYCSGTLIAPNLVLTAGHCVRAENDADTSDCGSFGADLAADTLGVAVGVSVGENSSSIATGIKTFHDTGSDFCGHDIGLVQLDMDIPNAQIAKLRFTIATPGEITSAVGYGEDGTGNPTRGRYQRGDLPITSVGTNYDYMTTRGRALPVVLSSNELATGESTCFGDSGGPLFDKDGAIIGITSRGIDQACVDRPSIWTDIASHAQLIKSALDAAGHPLADANAPGNAPSNPATPGDSATPSASSAPNTSGSTSNGTGPGTTADPASTTSPEEAGRASGPAASGCSASPSRAASSPASSLFASALGVAGALLARRRSKRPALLGQELSPARK